MKEFLKFYSKFISNVTLNSCSAVKGHLYTNEDIEETKEWESENGQDSMKLHIISWENLKFDVIPIWCYFILKSPGEDTYCIKTGLNFSKDNIKKMLSPLDITQSVSFIRVFIFTVCTFNIRVIALIKND